MMSFPRFLTLLLACLMGVTAGFVHTAPKFAATSKTLSPNSRLQPLVQVSSTTAFEPVQKGSLFGTSIKNVARKYVALNEEKPIMTKSVSAALVGAMGDVFSQSLFACATGTPFQWDMMRTVTFMMIGLCFNGPALHMWYSVLGRISKWTKIRMNFSPTSQNLTALTVDQTLGVAIFYPLYFVVFELFSALLGGRLPNLLALQTKMAASLLQVIFAQYYIWPLAQFLSFKYCPPSLRVLYTNGVSVFWNCFLCTRLAG